MCEERITILRITNPNHLFSRRKKDLGKTLNLKKNIFRRKLMKDDNIQKVSLYTVCKNLRYQN